MEFLRNIGKEYILSNDYKNRDLKCFGNNKIMVQNDSQVLEYEVTFISPDGDIYTVIDEHSAMTGWNFNHVDLIDIN